MPRWGQQFKQLSRKDLDLEAETAVTDTLPVAPPDNDTLDVSPNFFPLGE